MSFPAQAVVHNDQSTSSLTTAVAFGSNNTLGNILVVAIGYYGSAADPPTVTLSSLADSAGNVYSLVQGPVSFHNDGPMYIYWCPSCKAGANTVTGTWSTSVAFTEIIAVEYTTITNPHIDVSLNSTAGESQVTSVTLGPTYLTSTDILISYLRQSVAQTATPPVGTTLEFGSAATYGFYADQNNVSAGAITAGWSVSAAAYMGAILVAIRSGPPPVYAGPTFVQCNYALGAGVATLSCALTGAVGAGDTLIANIEVSNNTANFFVNGVTDTLGNRWKFLCSTLMAANQMMSLCAQNVKAAAPGALIVSIVFPSAPASSIMQVAEYTGANSIDTVSANTSSNTFANAQNVLLAGPNEILVGFVFSTIAGAPVITGGATLRQTTGTAPAGLGDLSVTNPIEVNFGWNVGNGTWGAHAIAISGALPRSFAAICPVPPMGYDTWQIYETSCTEVNAKAQANALVSTGLAALGYNLFNINDVLFNSRLGNNLQTNTALFPDGHAAVWTYIRGLGLTPAYYLAPGTVGCYTFPGSSGYETYDIALAISDGATYLMYDNCATFTGYEQTQAAYQTMATAIANSSNPNIKFLVSTGSSVFENDSGGTVWSPQAGGCIIWSYPDIVSGEMPHLLSWLNLLAIAEGQIVMTGWVSPGRWNLPAYLGTGNGLLTAAEGRSNFAIWAILAAPLWIGCDLTAISAPDLATLSNTEIIAINQDLMGIAGTRYSSVAQGGGLVEVWARPLSNGKWAVVLWNQAATSQTFGVSFSSFAPSSPPYTVRDVINHSTLTSSASSLQASVASHDVAMYLLTPPPPPPPPVTLTVGTAGFYIVQTEWGCGGAFQVANLAAGINYWPLIGRIVLGPYPNYQAAVLAQVYGTFYTSI